MKMELVGVNWVLAAAGFFLWTSVGLLLPWCATITPEHCVSSRGRTTRWGKAGWTTPACSAPVCTLWESAAARRCSGRWTSPRGVSCVWSSSCSVSLVQTADPRLPCSPGEGMKDPGHGSFDLKQQQLDW
ncbi:Prostate-associated microseminoprotein [Dissostichus eleginoides]|uniref:Prostate-associated microseminoprotein n=1 Tax=Dissostichus eleginoides TaxID=100907 RepID=A0AAD9BVE6_DISEL|nr:Prostate-associated microseminoprotein [Dissostichus eleginoides]